jgi:hypothetical protein
MSQIIIHDIKFYISDNRILTNLYKYGYNDLANAIQLWNVCGFKPYKSEQVLTKLDFALITGLLTTYCTYWHFSIGAITYRSPLFRATYRSKELHVMPTIREFHEENIAV